MRELLDLGVDGIMTDETVALRDALISRGEWHPRLARHTAPARPRPGRAGEEGGTRGDDAGPRGPGRVRGLESGTAGILTGIGVNKFTRLSAGRQ